MSTKTLTEANTLERARLNLRYKTKGLDQWERHRRTLLLGHDPARDLTLGGKAAIGPEFLELATKAAKATDKAGLMLDEDVSLAQAGPEESKTLLRMGLATSAGAFQSLDDSGEYQPTRRPLELLDLVRAGTTDEGTVQYMWQTTYGAPSG